MNNHTSPVSKSALSALFLKLIYHGAGTVVQLQLLKCSMCKRDLCIISDLNIMGKTLTQYTKVRMICLHLNKFVLDKSEPQHNHQSYAETVNSKSSIKSANFE